MFSKNKVSEKAVLKNSNSRAYSQDQISIVGTVFKNNAKLKVKTKSIKNK